MSGTKRTIITKQFKSQGRENFHIKGSIQLSVVKFLPKQSCLFHLGGGLVRVRTRVLFPPPYVTLQGCHDNQ